jgi:hypothetical protein
VVGVPAALTLSGHDSDGESVTFPSVQGLPAGLSADASGHIRGTPTAASSSWVTATAQDTAGHMASQSFLWAVTSVGLASVADQTSQEGLQVAPLTLAASGPGGAFTYSAAGLPPGVSLSPTTGMISGTPSAGAAASGPYPVTVAASNGTTASNRTFTWAITPYVTVATIPDQTNQEGDTVHLQVTASEPQGGPTLTYHADGLPAPLQIDSTGLISGAIPVGASTAGPYGVTVTVSAGPYASSRSFTLVVNRTSDQPPTLVNPGPQAGVAGDAVSLALAASDPEGDPLTFAATGLPDGLSLDPFAGVIKGTLGNGAGSPGYYPVTVTVDDSHGGTASQTFAWVVSQATLTGQASPLAATEGTDTGVVTVATFTDTNPNLQASDYSATITWGDDGSTSGGTVAASAGGFTVSCNHLFTDAGSFPVGVTVSDANGRTLALTGTATVAAEPIALVGGLTAGAVRGQGSSAMLAEFTDPNPGEVAGRFTAALDWGDNSGTTSGAITALGNGTFAVAGSHPYGANGSYAVRVRVTDEHGTSATATSGVVVGDLFAGLTSSLTVASFTAAPGSVPTDFVATISWGDGSSSVGVVAGSGGVFQVSGSHTYVVARTYTVGVLLTGPDGGTLGASSAVSVVRPPVGGLGSEVVAPAGSLSNAVLGTFAEPDAADRPGEFAATVNWGDGTPPDTTATVVKSGGLFQVVGSHTYTTVGLFPVQVVVSQHWDPLLKALYLNTAALVQGTGVPGPRAVTIRGPHVVPGGSSYLYWLDGIRPTDTVAWRVAGRGSDGKPAAQLAGSTGPFVGLLFQPTTARVTLTARVNGADRFVTIFVAKIDANPSPVVKDVSAQALPSEYPFAVQDLPTPRPGKMKPDYKATAVPGSDTKQFTFTGETLGLEGRRYMRNDPARTLITWRARVKALFPAGSSPAEVGQIRVGYIQMASAAGAGVYLASSKIRTEWVAGVDTSSGFVGPYVDWLHPSALAPVKDMINKTFVKKAFIDPKAVGPGTESLWPWYGLANPAGFYWTPANRIIAASGRVLSTNDNPSYGFPETYTGTMEGEKLKRGVGGYSFTTYLAVGTAETTGDPPTNVYELANWHFSTYLQMPWKALFDYKAGSAVQVISVSGAGVGGQPGWAQKVSSLTSVTLNKAPAALAFSYPFSVWPKKPPAGS